MDTQLPENGTEFTNPHTGGKVVFYHVFREMFPAHIEMLLRFAYSLKNGYGQLHGEEEKYPTVAANICRFNCLSPSEKEQYLWEDRLKNFEYGFVWNAQHLLTHRGDCPQCERPWGAIRGHMITCLCGQKVLLHFTDRLKFITEGPGSLIGEFDDVIYNMDHKNMTDPRDIDTVGSWDEALGAAAELYQGGLISYVSTVSQKEYESGNWFSVQLDEQNQIAGHQMLISLAEQAPKVYPHMIAFRLFFHWMEIEGKKIGQLVIVYFPTREKITEFKPLQLSMATA